jgi:putative DNA primase/helicase
MASVVPIDYHRDISQWRSRLVLNPETMQAKPSLANMITTFRDYPDWKGALGYDEFRRQVVLRRCPIDCGYTIKPGDQWTPEFASMATAWLDQHLEFGTSDSRRVEEALRAVARQQSFHPVREYLDRCYDLWMADQTPRIDTWLTAYGQAADTPYTRAIGARWPISAVARIYDPGCKADCVLIFRGKQGARKSSAFAILGGEWFVDNVLDLGSKDALITLHTSWIYEMGELSSLKRGEINTVKATVAGRVDTYRPPYGTKALPFPRQFVFAGTVNADAGYLTDHTGNRRWWDLEVGDFDTQALQRDRDLLWGEAVARYREGAVWWLDTPELVAAAEDATDAVMLSDDWEGIVRAWVDSPVTRHLHTEGVTTAKVLMSALSIEPGRITRADTTRVGIVIHRIGWERRRVTAGGHREWRYFPPGTPQELF